LASNPAEQAFLRSRLDQLTAPATDEV